MDVLTFYSSGDIYLKHNITERPCDSDFEMHIHDTCEIYLFMGGNAEYLVEGSVYPLDKESVILLAPFESHKTRILSSEPYERYVVNFPRTFLDSIDPERRLLNAFLSRENGKDNLYRKEELSGFDVKSLFDSACYCKEDEYGKILKIRSMLLQLLDVIGGAYKKRGKENAVQSREAEFVAYVNAHLAEDISVPSVAEHFFLSAAQFSRIFKNATGAAPWTYITLKRLNTARERLANGASVQSAFEESGFKDYSSFYRAYVRHFGRMPSEDIRK